MTLSTPISTVLGLIFVAAGCAAIWLIFDASRLVHDTAKRDRVLRAHRLAGYAFVAVFDVSRSGRVGAHTASNCQNCDRAALPELPIGAGPFGPHDLCARLRLG